MRLNLVVEGATEERFVKDVLSAHLGARAIDTRARMVATRRDRTHQGGGDTYKHLRRDLERWMREDRGSDVRFSTMFDLYGLPRDFPGAALAALAGDPYEKVKCIETALADDLSDRRLIAYVQLHEFEALLLSDPRCFDEQFLDHDAIARLVALSGRFASPELIDDGPTTAPSKRIAAEIPEFGSRKASAGPIIAAKIGLQTMRARCRHFDDWLCRLEALAAPLTSR